MSDFKLYGERVFQNPESPVHGVDMAMLPPSSVGDASLRKSGPEQFDLYSGSQKVASLPKSLIDPTTQAEMLAAVDAHDPTWTRFLRMIPDPNGSGKSVPVSELLKLVGTGRDLTRVSSENVRAAASEEVEHAAGLRQAAQAVANEMWPSFVRELFGRLYGEDERIPVEQVEKSGCSWVEALHGAADKSDSWEQLTELANGDPWAAGVGASVVANALAEKFSEELGKLPNRDPQQLRRNAKVLHDAAPKSAVTKEAKKRAVGARKAADAVARQLEQKDGTLESVIERAAAAASKELADTQAAVSSLGIGNQPGHASRVVGPRDELVKVIRTNDKFRKVAELAGRLKIAARAAQRAKVKYVPEQIVDVTMGGELARLLPSELCLLASEETELLGLRRLVEREALQYALSGHEALNRGPLVLCVDESGSMYGERHEMAMAFAVALLEVCAMQRRAFALLHFDMWVRKKWIVGKPSSVQLSELVENVAHFSGGGTDFSPPLHEAAGVIEAHANLKNADVILLTDGAANWSKVARQAVEFSGARLHGVEIGGCFTEAQKSEMASYTSIDLGLANTMDALRVPLSV